MNPAYFSDRRAVDSDLLASALLDAGGPLTFDQLAAAAAGADDGDVASWLGHAIEEGLIEDAGTGPEGGRLFALRARGRRIFSARRRAHELH